MLSCAAAAGEASTPTPAASGGGGGGGGGPSYVGAGAGSVATAGTQSVAYPAGLASGDLLVISATAHVGTVSTPAGWTKQYGGDSNGVSETGYIFVKTATGSESGSITLTSSSTFTVARMYAFRGQNASPYEAHFATADNGGPTLTTLGADRLALAFYGGYGSAPNVIAGASGGTWTLADSYRDGSSTMCCSLCTCALAAATTISGGASTSYGECVGEGIALKP